MFVTVKRYLKNLPLNEIIKNIKNLVDPNTWN